MDKAKIPDGFFKYRSRANTPPSFNMASIFGTGTKKGQVGIEVEVEGNKFPKHRTSRNEAVSPELIPKIWLYKRDGSLRGEDNAEYITDGPVMFDDVPKHVDDLFNMFDKFGSVLDDSNRTSVHVHLNAQEWHLDRLTCFLAMYFCLEEVLTQWCGEHRVGNLFCLRAKDATGIVKAISSFIEADGNYPLNKNLHYAGLNIHALAKFGSIEVRSLRGVRDPETLKTWVGILRRLYEMSANYKDPRDVIENFSGIGPMAYLEELLGPYTATVVENSGYTQQQIMEAMYEGIRLAQDLCYCRDWEFFNKADLKPDPFRRSARKVYSQMYGTIAGAASQPSTATPGLNTAEFDWTTIDEL